MALWDVTQTTTHLWDGRTFGPDVIGVVNDQTKTLQAEVLALFGTTERAAVRYELPQDGVILATIQWSPENTPGWVRDRDSPGAYIVVFRAVRH